MSLFVYAPVIKEGTRELIEALGAKRLSRFDGLNFIHKGTPLAFNEKKDTIVCWGASVPPTGKLRIFNNHLTFSSHIQMNTAIGNMVPPEAGWRFIPMLDSPVRMQPGQLYAKAQLGMHVMPFEGSARLSQQLQRSSQEYRISYFGGTVVKAEKKYPIFNKIYDPISGIKYEPDSMSHRFIRSKAAGWEWRECKETLDNIPKVVSSLQKKLGLDFFVVSILASAKDGNINKNAMIGGVYNFIRKITTAPKLSPMDVTLYKHLLYDWIKSNGGSVVY